MTTATQVEVKEKPIIFSGPIEDGDDELHVNAMMDRLWPDWHKQTGGEDLS